MLMYLFQEKKPQVEVPVPKNGVPKKIDNVDVSVPEENIPEENIKC